MLNLKKGAYRRLFLLLGCLFPLTVHAETACPAKHIDEFATVRYVHDGDTLHLEDGRKVRLIGINTPELAHDNRPEQAFAQTARTFLIKAIAAHDNRVALVYGEEHRDRHQRTLAHLFSPDGGNFQAQLLQQGLAAAIAYPPNVTFAECYAGQEKIARCAGNGIWSHPQHAVLQAADLTAGNTGFHVVNGKVEHISASSSGIWLLMAELMIGIRRENLDEFDQAELLSLKGKYLTVRGWLQRSNKKQANRKFRNSRTVNYFMRIRHPASIEINQAAFETGC
jgi:endonuclease YncB( thermonuclease family)